MGTQASLASDPSNLPRMHETYEPQVTGPGRERGPLVGAGQASQEQRPSQEARSNPRSGKERHVPPSESVAGRRAPAGRELTGHHGGAVGWGHRLRLADFPFAV